MDLFGRMLNVASHLCNNSIWNPNDSIVKPLNRKLMKRNIFFFSLLIIFMSTFITAQTPDAFMIVRGSIQGDISDGANSEASTGLAANPFHGDKINIYAMEFEGKREFDPNTGMYSSSITPCVLKIKKLLDGASPLLLQAFGTNELLDEVSLRFWRRNRVDQEHYYTLTFTNARVVSIRTVLPDITVQENTLEGITGGNVEFEEVSFSYSSLTVTHEVVGNVTTINY